MLNENLQETTYPGKNEGQLVSVVVPCFNEEQTIPLFYPAIKHVSDELHSSFRMKMEFIFVNDGSQDKTLEELRILHKKDSRVRYVSFSRNFGKESALFAGLKAAHGDYVATMDADLQDPPSLLPSMMKVLLNGEGYECVATRRSTRKGEPPIRSFFAHIFYKIINRLSDTEIVDGSRDYRLMSRKFVNAVLSLSEYNRFSKGIFSWVGFKTKWISYKNIDRAAGHSKWNFHSLFHYAVSGIIGFSVAPLEFASFMGLFFCLLAVIGIIFVFIRALAFGDPVAGWPSTICIILLIGGLQFFCIGVVGEYLARTYLEVKRRPLYIISRTEKDDDLETSVPNNI